jgi:ferredoxin
MATMITSECINCGACEPECPNTAIYQGEVEWLGVDGAMHKALSDEIFYIVPEKCTECVGFHDHEACAAVCPVDCCVPNPAIPETHEVLLVRARALHPEETIPDDAPSRFKKDGGDAPVSGDAPAAPAAAAAAPAAAKPAAAPAKAAAPPKAAGSGKVEKASAPPVPRVQKRFAGELPVEYDQLVVTLGAPRRRISGVARVPLLLLATMQGLLGALPAGMKLRIEEAVSDTRFFSAQLATAANVFLNLVIYPVVCVVFAIAAGRAGFFTAGVHSWITLGVGIAVAEAAWRLRESFFRGAPIGQVPLRGAIYGPLVLPLGAIVLALAGRRSVQSGVGFDGFYAGREPFDEKLERARRYGEVYRLEERDDAYVLRLEFPRRVPPSSLGDHFGLPTEMPDYDYEVGLEGSGLVVHGRVIDPQVRKITGVAPAFPSEFTTRIPLANAVTGFRQRYHDRTLEVILPKVQAA